MENIFKTGLFLLLFVSLCVAGKAPKSDTNGKEELSANIIVDPSSGEKMYAD